jgi:thiol:disulfide interchange protein
MKKIFLALLISTIFVACKSVATKDNAATTTESTTTTAAKAISWSTDANLATALVASQNSNQNIFVDVSTVWCGYCKKMKKSVYTQGTIINALNTHYVALALDGENGDGKDLVAKYGINGFPTQLILNANGEIVKQNTGYLNEDELLTFLK